MAAFTGPPTKTRKWITDPPRIGRRFSSLKRWCCCREDLRPRQAAAYLARDGLALFENPDAHLICTFKRGSTLCAPSSSPTAPEQFDCQPGCTNTVRLDQHAQELLRQAGDARATSPDQIVEGLHNAVALVRTSASCANSPHMST